MASRKILLHKLSLHRNKFIKLKSIYFKYTHIYTVSTLSYRFYKVSGQVFRLDWHIYVFRLSNYTHQYEEGTVLMILSVSCWFTQESLMWFSYTFLNYIFEEESYEKVMRHGKFDLIWWHYEVLSHNGIELYSNSINQSINLYFKHKISLHFLMHIMMVTFSYFGQDIGITACLPILPTVYLFTLF